MNEMLNKFSLALCQHLSSLVPGFEGHYEHVPYLIAGTTEDLLRYEVRCKNEPREALPSPFYDDVKPVPAWTVEDVLRNLRKILPTWDFPENVGQTISDKLVLDPDTAYQKIEEYLWTIIK